MHGVFQSVHNVWHIFKLHQPYPSAWFAIIFLMNITLKWKTRSKNGFDSRVPFYLQILKVFKGLLIQVTLWFYYYISILHVCIKYSSSAKNLNDGFFNVISAVTAMDIHIPRPWCWKFRRDWQTLRLSLYFTERPVWKNGLWCYHLHLDSLLHSPGQQQHFLTVGQYKEIVRHILRHDRTF